MTDQTLQVASFDLRFLPVSDLHANPSNPRSTIEEAPLKELERSIRAIGIQQPIGVRALSGEFEIVWGHRRAEAARRIGLELVPCRVLDLDEYEALEAALVENRVRVEVSAFDESLAVGELVKAGRSFRGIGASLGISSARVRRLANLSSLVKTWREALENSVSRALWTEDLLELVALTSPEVQEELAAVYSPADADPPEPAELRRHILKLCRRLDLAEWSLEDSSLSPGRPSCSDCADRSDSAGGLFEGLEPARVKAKSGALCRNSKCWEEKAHAYLSAQFAHEFEKHGADLVLVHGQDRGDGFWVDWKPPTRPLGTRDYETRKRKGAGVVPAFVVTGKGQGSTIYIKVINPVSPKKTTGRQLRGEDKPEPGTRADLKHRREHLSNRRTAWVVDYVREELEAFLDKQNLVDDAELLCVPESTALQLVFRFGASPIRETPDRLQEPQLLAGRVAVLGVLGACLSSLHRSGFNGLHKLLEDCLELAGALLYLTPDDLAAKAEAKIPAPKALERLEAKFGQDPPTTS